MNQLNINTNEFTLERLPRTDKGDLRAWDAADELLLNTIFESHLDKDTTESNESGNEITPVLIINDSFGALACALNDYPRHSWSDSFQSHLATLENLYRNRLNSSNYQAIGSSTDLEIIYDLVIIKIPKTLGLLEDQLSRLKAHINADTTIIASAMSKHIHTSTLKTFEKFIGTTTTSRATKKARLIFAKNDNESAYPSPFPKIVKDNELYVSLSNHANVFAKDKLDIGTRFLIEQLKRCPSSKHIVDLGCGNGALGIMAQRVQPQAHISFIDESYGAVKSAQESYKLESERVSDDINNESDSDSENKNLTSSFYHSDCFKQFDATEAESKVDLILCNPPFHQNHSIGDHIAWEMFKQSHEQLESEGEIWVVGNRHLGYHVKLAKLFGNCETVASNKKFVILVSKKSAK
jgi:16S rRNA G1207 methylase RsmC